MRRRSPLLSSLLALLSAACPGRSPPEDVTTDAAGTTEASSDASSLDAAADAPAMDARPDVPLPIRMTVLVPNALAEVARAWAAYVPATGVAVQVTEDPDGALQRGEGTGVLLAARASLADCTQCYAVSPAARGASITGDSALSVQYGLTHALEAMGYRFFHPQRGIAPATVAPPPASALPSGVQRAQQTVRGLHLHTLHPIEGLVFWVPGADNAERARAIIDWLVRNRGNYLNLVALNNILLSSSARADWAAHLGPLLQYAHLRGVRVGLGIQLFSGSNLQHAFDLLDSATDPAALDRITTRLHAAFDGMPFDNLSLSFGEFSTAADPATFIARVNDVRAALDRVAPSMELSASIHVGNMPSLRVSYLGQSMLYYFLVRYADPRVIPWVHTVMYYDLFEDAGGAYLHDNFDEHRAYLLDRMRAGQRAAYHPESAYWVNFDNSVPTFLPLYVRSRWYDLSQLHQAATAGGFGDLREHVTFSSGWEWGYWLNDVSVLRQGFSLTARYGDTMREQLAIFGPAGSATADAVEQLADLHHDTLLGQRLAAYLAGRDFVTKGGAASGIVSQPARPGFDELALRSAADRATFARDVVDRLDSLAQRTAPILTTLNAALGSAPERFLAELRDGVEIDLLRTRFAAAVWRAPLSFAATGSDGGTLAEAQRQLDAARLVVRRRHADLHWDDARRLLPHNSNPTLYQYGYLYFADQLCFWQRELAQAQSASGGPTNEPPGCFF